MQSKELMLLAIQEARKSQQPLRCGVVVARSGEVVAKSCNKQREDHDTTAHAEILAIRAAGKKLGRKNLDDCVMYCTCEPCSMCLSAAIFAKIPKLYFGVSLEEASSDNLPIRMTTKELIEVSDHKIEIASGYMKKECFDISKKF